MFVLNRIFLQKTVDNYVDVSAGVPNILPISWLNTTQS